MSQLQSNISRREVHNMLYHTTPRFPSQIFLVKAVIKNCELVRDGGQQRYHVDRRAFFEPLQM
jgi:hypothetical protein